MSASDPDLYRTDHLPPRPDRETGLPRPPQARIENMLRPVRGDPDPRHRPQPPPGQGPVLEYFKERRRRALGGGLFVGAVVAIVITARNGFDWMSDPWAWAIALSPVAMFLIFQRVDILAAGADWVLWKKHWVATYDLASVRIAPRGAELMLKLVDRKGRRVSIPWTRVGQSQPLWDLVYNGILHSAHNGPFESNGHARGTLRLPR